MKQSETKTCQNCKQDFTIEPEDFVLLKKINVPSPTFCPTCRLQRRLAHRNERNLFKRKCDLCGNSTLSMYPEDTTFPVYCRECWISDKWDGLDYGKEYNFSKSFFEQFKELEKTVPKMAAEVADCINSDFINHAFRCKNSYLISGSVDDEDCYYGERLINSKSCVDNFLLLKCENCYESNECRDSASLRYTENAADVMEMLFCYDARGSQHCFMSSNLRNDSYVFRNRKLNKEEYVNKLQALDTGSHKVIEQLKEEYERLVQKALHKYTNSKNVINSSGHAFSNSKDAYWVFNAADLENCRYMYFSNNTKDSMDVNNSALGASLCYESNSTGANASNIKFCRDAWPEVSNLEYCIACRNGVDSLFGCTGLRSKKYCILNKQYTKEEYASLVPNIIKHMDDMPYIDKKGRVYKYGEFFPVELSEFSYNGSVAQDIFHLSENEAKEAGFTWHEKPNKKYIITKTLDSLPDHINDVEDNITKEVIECAHQGKCEEHCVTAFRITNFELKFYKKMKLPIPRLCPNCRYHRRLNKRNPYFLWPRQCMCDYKAYKNTVTHDHHKEGRCPNEFETSYSPEQKEIVYCEKCYQAEVI